MIESNKCVLRRLNDSNFIFIHKVYYKRIENKRKSHKGVYIFLHGTI